MGQDPILPYKPIQEVATDLYCMDGDWSTFKRRMTLMRLKAGDLLVHSAIRLKEEDYSWIDRLGEVKYVIVPNRFHCSEAHHYLKKYPGAKLLVSKQAIQQVSPLVQP